RSLILSIEFALVISRGRSPEGPMRLSANQWRAISRIVVGFGGQDGNRRQSNGDQRVSRYSLAWAGLRNSVGLFIHFAKTSKHDFRRAVHVGRVGANESPDKCLDPLSGGIGRQFELRDDLVGQSSLAVYPCGKPVFWRASQC